MSDVFTINWSERMKTDPQANSIMNNKTNIETFQTYILRKNPATGNWQTRNAERKTFKRRKTQFYSDKYVKDFRDFPSGADDVGKRFRLDNHAGGPAPTLDFTNNPNKYWENTTPKSVYNHISISQAPNPHIEKISYTNIQ